MNLPYPFDNATGVKASPLGTINLVDQQGKAIAQLPIITAYTVADEESGPALLDERCGDGYGDGSGAYGQGSYFGCGYGIGNSTVEGYGTACMGGSGLGSEPSGHP
jgi:hypothetical protein